MKKKAISMILVAGLAFAALAGCQQTAAPMETSSELDGAEMISELPSESEAPELELIQDGDGVTDSSEGAMVEEPTEKVIEMRINTACSMCEVEKECGVYDANEERVAVCDDCYPAFEAGKDAADSDAEDAE